MDICRILIIFDAKEMVSMKKIVPGDSDNAQYLWPIEPLQWWRGENSFRRGNPYEESEHQNTVELGELLKKHGGEKSVVSLIVDRKKGEPYALTMDRAKDAFRVYAQAGMEIFNGGSEDRYQYLMDFIRTFGVPCDVIGNSFYAESLEDALISAQEAALCVRLLEFAQKRRSASIQAMSSLEETPHGVSVTFRWETPKSCIMSPPIAHKPGNIKPTEWIDLAFEAVEQITASNASSLRIVGDKRSRSLVLVPAGLKTMLWLAFRLQINDALDLPQVTKTCLSNERFHGCGRLFIPSHPRQKFCPECQARAQTEAKARWRAKKKQDATTQ